MASTPDPLVAGTHAEVYDGAEWDRLDTPTQQVSSSAPADTDDEDIPVYKIPVAFPSTRTDTEIQAQQLAPLLMKELELRIGQAEDALSQLRVLLAWKSVMFRTGVQMAETYPTRTRAWHEIVSIATAVQHQCRVYEMTRRAMYNISDTVYGFDPAKKIQLRKQFPPLIKKDIWTSTQFLASDIRGQRHEHQSWIWSRNLAQNEQDTEWLDECV